MVNETRQSRVGGIHFGAHAVVTSVKIDCQLKKRRYKPKSCQHNSRRTSQCFDDAQIHIYTYPRLES